MRFFHILKSLFASVLIMSLVACAPTPTQEGTGEYVDDALITTKVKAALAADPQVKATEVKVTTYKGIVQLSGFVSSREAMERAVQIARGVEGVRDVKNNMEIKPVVQ